VQRIVRLLKNRPHLVATYIMIALVLPTVLWWRDSILWVLLLSLYANVYSSISADQAQQAKMEARDNAQNNDS
jgi:hypothetical protein